MKPSHYATGHTSQQSSGTGAIASANTADSNTADIVTIGMDGCLIVLIIVAAAVIMRL